MNILITGNTGYIGPELAKHLRATLPGVKLYGYDSGFFAHCLTAAECLPEFNYDRQYWGDIRHVPPSVLDGIDAVVHLAAVSNDPMGNRFEQVTRDINFAAGSALATQAKARGVSRFVFASSCSMYGYAEGAPRKETDGLNPLTAYARSKVAMETALEKEAGSGFLTTSLRFSTACGMSDRLRLDLVLNDFVACAVSCGEITVLSDGTPWRPLIDVKDMARAIEWALARSAKDGGDFVAVNIGSTERNYQVKDLAKAVADLVPNSSYSINMDALPDKRSYQVDFSKYAALAPDHLPQVSLKQSILEIKAGLEAMDFSNKNFRNSYFMRLEVLDNHIKQGRLNESLQWIGKAHYNMF